MKYLSTIIPILLATGQGYAQNIEGNYQYRVGDEVRKQIVAYEATMIEPKDSVWNLLELEELGTRRRVTYLPVYEKTEEFVSSVEKNTRYYFEQRNDSLLFWGSENNLTKEVYDRPIMQLHTPLVLGNQYNGFFHGRMSYCERIFSRVYGSWSLSVDAKGMLLMPEGDTLNNVHLVHLHTVKVSIPYSHISTQEELKTYVDSIAPYTTDSILIGLQDSMRHEVTDIYRWYAPGYRYPVLEMVNRKQKGKTSQQEAFYLSPAVQETLDDAENELFRQQLANMKTEISGGAPSSMIADGDNPSPVSRCDVSVVGQTIKVNFDLNEDATVKGFVCDVLGMVLRQESHHYAAGSDCELTLDCAGLRSGSYVLYLNCNRVVVSHTVNL